MATNYPVFNPLVLRQRQGLTQAMLGYGAFSPTPAPTQAPQQQAFFPETNMAPPVNQNPPLGWGTQTVGGNNQVPAIPGTPQTPNQATPYSPQNYNELAEYEEKRRNAFGDTAAQQIADARSALSRSLNEQGQGFFNQMNPGILEDLNSRGLLRSPTAVNTAQADALKQIELANMDKLFQYDAAGTSARLQAQQDALDSGLDLRRAGLEQHYGNVASNQEEALARDLAKQQARNQLTNSLIGAGGSLGAGYLSGAFGGGGGAAGGSARGAAGAGGLTTLSSGATSGSFSGIPYAGAGTPASSMFPGGVGSAGVGTGGAVAAKAGIGPFGSMGLLGPALGVGASLALRNAVKKETFGRTGTDLFHAAAPFFAPDLALKRANQVGKVVANRAMSAARGVGRSVSRSVKRAFCFGGMTPITMSDGSTAPICEVNLGDETKGGTVQSVRISLTDEGTLFEYKGETVTGSHAVLEDGDWIRVEDSKIAEPLEGDGEVYSLVTSKHRIYVGSTTFADEHETDDYESLNMDQSLDELNRQENYMKVSANGN